MHADEAGGCIHGVTFQVRNTAGVHTALNPSSRKNAPSARAGSLCKPLPRPALGGSRKSLFIV